jgi:hypothetical protein
MFPPSGEQPAEATCSCRSRFPRILETSNSARTRALARAASVLAVAGPSCRGSGELPPPACEIRGQCTAAGLEGALCIDGRCRYTGTVHGSVRSEFPDRPGSLHVMIYRPEGLAPTGPVEGVDPVAGPLVVPSPSWPEPYMFAELPQGTLWVYAFVDVGDDNPSSTRACLEDIVGDREFAVTGDDGWVSTDGGSTVDVSVVLTVGAGPWSCEDL